MADPSLPVDFAQKFALRPPIEPFSMAQGTNSRTTGVHTGDGDFLCKRYQPVHTEASIDYEHRLLGWLAAHGLSFAVPAPVPTVDGDTLYATDDGLHALFPLIPGSPPDYGNLRSLENAGAALAELHITLAGYPADSRPGMSGFDALATVHPAISNPQSLYPSDLGLPDREPFASLLAWWREEAAAVQAFIDGPFQALPRQVIHGDFTPANTLHAGGRLTGIIDFEFAGPDVRAMDVASSLYFCLRIWQGDDPWPRGEAFVRGYTGQTELIDSERSALPWLMRLRNATSKVFWLGKSLAGGAAEKQVLDIGDLQGFNRWLTGNRERLINLSEK